jgi:hypothetical protein
MDMICRNCGVDDYDAWQHGNIMVRETCQDGTVEYVFCSYKCLKGYLT